MERVPGPKNVERVIERVSDVTDDRTQNIERLLSERRDGRLSAQDLAEIERAIAGDSANARSAEAFDRLGALLKDWRIVPATIDWQTSARRVSERVRADRSSAEEPDVVRLASTDRLVREWAGPMPAVDWPALSTRISNAVREEAGRAGQTRRTRWSWFVKAGAPLATAAVIVLAATWWITTGPKLPIDGGSSGASLVMVVLEMPVAVGKVSISFDLSPVGAPDRPDAESGGRAIAYGPKINDTLDTDADAFFY